MTQPPESIVFTLLPNGATADGKNLKFSVFVSPRLISPGGGTNTLADFQAHWKDWPSTLKGLSFTVTFNHDGSSVGPLSAHLVTAVGPPPIPNSTLWQQIFPLSTFVQPYEFDNYGFDKNGNALNILSYPTANVHSFIQSQYLAVATSSPTTFPPINRLGNNGFGKIGFYKSPIDIAQPFGPGVSQATVDQEIFKLLSESQTGGYSTTTGLVGRGAIDYTGTDYTGDPLKQQMDFEQVNLFFKSLKPVAFIADTTPSNPKHGNLKVPTIDFHREVSALSQYTGTSDSPGLMRQLGLIFDLELPAAAQLAQIQALSPGTAQLSVSGWPSASPTTQTPNTAFKLDASKLPTVIFVAQVNPANTNPDLGNASTLNKIDNGIGLLMLANGKYMPFEIDLDAAAIRALAFAIALLRLSYGPNIAPDTPQSLSLPSLKSGGISIAKMNRAFALALALKNTELTNSNINNGILYAEDLVRGYRVDVYNDKQTSTTKWLSLCWRMGTYTYNKTPITGIPADEGWVSMGATQNVNPPPSLGRTLNLHETMIRWKGWSLCAPRPSTIKRISQDNEHNTEMIDTYDPEQALSDSNNSDAWKNNNPPINIPLSVTFQLVKGTLPTLRFGKTYFMRARAVDLAGNGLPVDDQSIKDVSSIHPWLSPPITYGRFEPVQAPVVVLREPLNPALPAYINGNPIAVIPPGSQYSPGESLDHLVFRSGGGKAATSAATYNGNLNTLLGLNQSTGKAFLDHSERNIAPPRTTESMAELHGMFDDSTGKFNPSVATYADIVARDPMKFDEYQTSLTNLELMSYPAEPNFDPTDRDVHYIADPMAAGAAFKFFDPEGNLLGILKIPFYPSPTAWPSLKLLELSIGENSSNTFTISPPLTPSPKLPTDVTVTLAKGTYVDVQLSSYLDPKNAPTDPKMAQTMGILGWVQRQKPGQLASLASSTQNGQFWMITPYRKLRLVHAVQQPAGAPGLPKFSSLSQSRSAGATFASLSGGMLFHGTSTVKLDLLAAWEEPIDSPGSDPYNPQPVQDGQPWGAPGLTPPGPTSAGGVHHAQHVVEFPGLDPGLAPSGSTAMVFSGRKHEFGDTKRRLVRYTLAGTTRYLEHLPDQVWKDQQGNPILDANGLPGAVVRYANDDKLPDPSDNTKWINILDIPSTARPDKPKILYVVPTFAWGRKGQSDPFPLPEWSSGSRSDSSLKSTKSGGGLRVYMERPWYSSGFGELLGVILWPGDKNKDLVPPDNLKSLVTQWGQDPLWASAGTAGPPTIKNFTGTASNKNPYAHLAETGDLVIVVPYNVAFDKGRNLWYADLQLILPTYLPFIRLALVRYQPNGVNALDTTMSPVVLADFAQVTPDRTLSVVGAVGSKQLNLTLSGIFPQRGTQSRTNIVLVFLQSRQSGVPDPDLGWSDVPNVGATLIPDKPNAPQMYTGTITLPTPRGPGADFRLLVTEYEHYSQDPSLVVPPPPDRGPLNPNPDIPGFRLVYAEAVPI